MASGTLVARPVTAVRQVASDPVGTLQGVPEGLNKRFKGLYYKAKKTGKKVKQEVQEELADDEVLLGAGQQSRRRLPAQRRFPALQLFDVGLVADGIDGDAQAPDHARYVSEVHADVGLAVGGELAQAGDQGLPVVSLQEVARSIEQVYLQAVSTPNEEELPSA